MRLEEWSRSADNGTSALKSIIHDGVVALCHEWAGKSPHSSIPALVGAGLAQWRWLSAQGIGNKPVNSSPHECRKIGDYSIGTFGLTRGKRASCAQAP